MSDHASSIRSWASSCWPQSPSTTGVGVDARSRSNASASECAGSVDSTIVRAPRSAQCSAVAAAVVVLPTPPFPVKSSTLMARLRFDRGTSAP